MADGTLTPPEGEQIKLVINRMTEEQYQQLVALSAEYLSTELSNQLFLTDGDKSLSDQYKTYDETVTALTSQSGFKTYAQTSAQLSNDGYATQGWVQEQGFGGGGVSLSDVQATIFDFGNGDLSAFGWEGELSYQDLIDVGIKAQAQTVVKNPAAVRIGNGVTSIGNYAFYNCTRLSNVAIPNSVTSIGIGAFQGCEGLTSVTIPNSVTSIERSAFYGCDKLTGVMIPNSVESIENMAFAMTLISSVTIPNSVTNIKSYTFLQCASLTGVTIPDSVISVEEYAFYECSRLAEIKVEGKTQAEAEALLSGVSVPAGCRIKTWNFQPAGESGSYISQSQLASAILSAGRVPDGDGSNLQNAISVLNALIDALSALTT